jgi:hypothetical protein
MAGNQDAFAAGHGGAGGTPVNRDSGEVQVYDEKGRRTTAPEGSGVSINGKTLSHEEFADLARTNPEMHRQISGLRETGRVAQVRENEKASKADVITAGGTVGTGEVHPEVQKELDKIKAAATRAPRTPAAESTPKPSRTPANRIRGTVVEPTLPGRSLVNHAEKTHRQYETIARTLAVSKDPVVSDMGFTALDHLSKAKPKIEEAKALHDQGGDAQYQGNERVISAHPHIQDAHDTLNNEYIKAYGERAGVNTELPQESLDKLTSGVHTAPVLKKAKAMPDINFGGKSRRLDAPEIKEAEKRARTDESPAAQAAGAKIRTAKRGTPRMYASERNTPVPGSVTGEDMEATTPMGAGRNGRGPRAKKPVSSNPGVAPITRVRTPASTATPKTTISNGSRVGLTPKFDATSAIEGGEPGMAAKKGKN